MPPRVCQFAPKNCITGTPSERRIAPKAPMTISTRNPGTMKILSMKHARSHIRLSPCRGADVQRVLMTMANDTADAAQTHRRFFGAGFLVSQNGTAGRS